MNPDYNRRRICINEECGGKHNCHCKTCDKLEKCPKFLSATIRITNKCTQSCLHCCFSSHPKSSIMMSLEKAKEIAKFIKSNNVFRLNIMGGEFFCNPAWYEILDALIDSSWHTRLVSNSDWAKNEKVKEGLKKLGDKYKGLKFHISLSKDKWHTNTNVDKAAEFLEVAGISYNVAKEGDMTDDSIVPVGRGELMSYGFYSFLGAYCQNPENQYSFLIDEEGNIYKCSFGTWKYANIQDYLDGGFEERFKEYHQALKQVFIPNCKTCRRSAERWSGTEKADGEEIVIKCT